MFLHHCNVSLVSVNPHPVKCWILEIKDVPVFFSVGSTTSSTALQNEGELGDDDVFTVSTFPTFMYDSSQNYGL